MADDTDTKTTTDTAAGDAAEADAAFGSGFAGVDDRAGKPDKADTKPPANGKADPVRDAASVKAEPPPETVQITKKEWDEIKAATSRTASYDAQFSRLFGTTGAIQKLLNEQKPQAAPPTARKVEISPAAFAEMSKDFPEIAAQTRAALEAALSGLPVHGGDADPAKLESLMAQYTAKREIEALEDAFPEWRQIVGAVDITKEQPPANNAFRKWLSQKDETYQNRVNGSESAAVIGRAIRTFQRETAAAPAKPNGTPTPREAARRDAIRNAVQPRGDNAGAAPSNTAEDAFAAGFGR